MRFERKIPIYGYDLKVIEHFIRMHVAGFRKIYQTREVNNIYFDTASLDCGYANIEGYRKRWKIRIRWYGPFFGLISSPRLEIKIKQDHLGYKKVFTIDSFIMEEKFNAGVLYNKIEDSSIPRHLKKVIRSLHPVLINSYLRTYLLSNDGKFRITMDSDLKFGNIHQTIGKIRLMRDENTVILEVKYDQEHDDDVEFITSRLPWRVSKNSKYINALSRLY